MKFIKNYLKETSEILDKIDREKINKIILTLCKCKKKEGRLFFVGVGGSAGHCSHAVNDFRKICGFSAFTPVDNVSELTARINDEGWANSFKNFLKPFKVTSRDILIVFSVGGGSKLNKVSENIVEAIDFAISKKMKIISVVGKKDGHAYQKANLNLLIESPNKNYITPHTEGLTAVIWHLLVSHPLLKKNQTKWESIKR